MTIKEMHSEVNKYCNSFYSLNCKGCMLETSDKKCIWLPGGDESTMGCYWFLMAKGLIGKPEQPEINFIKAERNDEVEPTNDTVNHPNHYC